ncbi:Oidioi.mRNA.OKI2018_I69.PAR.g8981.t1.cds [Oikopleura dioica]|uniref:Oidioi.mRNA.OKI2018_I69.PAR.g8981.t1.cds n=1 Tax=Oikopleura dioica TaxID=34765 RepID=A0ABN7RII2_OIKDI|nr:Oidioi.mRNA.OKI2018_I69.PAR.g8981.t1.cds [Oikopleura dioica]
MKINCETLLLFLWQKIQGNRIEWKFEGPGLNEQVNLPVRYFYGIPTQNGTIFSDFDPSDISFKIIDEKSGKRARARTDFGVTHDGRVLFRYKVISPFLTSSTLKLQYRNSPIFEKTFKNLLSESCSCPKSRDEFKNSFQCEEFKHLTSSFNRLKSKKITKETIANHSSKTFADDSVVHYIIKNNRLYSKTLSPNLDFKRFSDGIILSLLRKVRLPDIEFFFNVGDWPLSTDFPIFSWCGSDSTSDIVVPTWDQIKTTLLSMSKINVDILTMQLNGPKWKQKVPKGFFRGRDSSKERIRVSSLNNTSIDAGITSFQFHSQGEDKKVPIVPMTDFGNFKFQLLLDGTVAPYRAPYIFQTNSLIFKQKSKYAEWWYPYLRKDIDFVEVDEKTENIEEKIQWALENDEIAEWIAQNGFDLTRDLLKPENVYCHYLQAFEQYSELMDFDPTVTEDFELIDKDPEITVSTCNCEMHESHDEL